jgi:hypothetical protein
MTICPVAIAASCEKCPIVNMCPGKTIIGDYPKEEKSESKEKEKQ